MVPVEELFPPEVVAKNKPIGFVSQPVETVSDLEAEMLEGLAVLADINANLDRIEAAMKLRDAQRKE
jgi:hypothetical protein